VSHLHRAAGVSVSMVLAVVGGCKGRTYTGLLSTDALLLSKAAANWHCRPSTLNTTRVGSSPFRLCDGTVADTQVGVLSDREGLVLEVARGWRRVGDPEAEFSRLGEVLVRGTERRWCDTLSVIDSRLAVDESTYTVLTRYATPPSIAIHRGLGWPYCWHDPGGHQ
jgi:hypothetical protein